MPNVRYTCHVELTGEIPREFESAILEEAMSLAVLGVLSGVIWVGQSPYPDGDPFLVTSEDGGQPDPVLATVQFTATDPTFSIVGQPDQSTADRELPVVPLCRCGAVFESIVHVVAYVSGLPGHRYDPAS